MKAYELKRSLFIGGSPCLEAAIQPLNSRRSSLNASADMMTLTLDRELAAPAKVPESLVRAILLFHENPALWWVAQALALIDSTEMVD